LLAEKVGKPAMPAELGFAASGIVSSSSDVDVWRVPVDGFANITVVLRSFVSARFTHGRNLVPALTLLDGAGSPVAQGMALNGLSSVSAEARGEGPFFLQVRAGPMAELAALYGSLGQYWLAGEVGSDTPTSPEVTASSPSSSSSTGSIGTPTATTRVSSGTTPWTTEPTTPLCSCPSQREASRSNVKQTWKVNFKASCPKGFTFRFCVVRETLESGMLSLSLQHAPKGKGFRTVAVDSTFAASDGAACITYSASADSTFKAASWRVVVNNERELPYSIRKHRLAIRKRHCD
jgi:hypothetical protein